MANNLYDYFTGLGKKLPSVAERAQTYGLGSSYTGTADQNTALLGRLQGQGLQGQNQATTVDTPTNTATTPTPQVTTPTATPVAPTGGNTSGVDTYLQNYMSSLKPTQDETNTQDQLTQLQGNTRQGVAGLAGRGLGTPLSLVRGQQAMLQQQGELGQQTLQSKLANLQKTRQSAIDVSKFALERADSAAKTVSDRAYQEQKLTSDRKYDKEKAQYEQTLKNSSPYTLNAGDTRYDSSNNKVASVAPKPTGTGGLTPYQKFQATQSISKDNATRTSNAREITRQANVMNQSYNTYISGGDKNISTQAIIATFNKILDPTSVVRESEYDRTAAGQSLIQRIQGKVDNISKGGAGVTAETLKAAVDLSNEYLKNAQNSLAKENERSRAMATQFGINPDFVTSPSVAGPEQKQTRVYSKSEIPTGYYQASDGLLYKK